VVVLVVESCNGAPEAAVTDLIDGRYSVGVETTQSWNRGNECADAVEIEVDPELASFEIEDLVGGTVFTVP